MSDSERIDTFLESLEYFYPDEKLYYPTDLKEAIIGTVESKSNGTTILLDRTKCLTILMEKYGMDETEALEHFEFNVIGSYFEGCPSFATLLDDRWDLH